jgi:hypothetical protein
MVTERDAVVDCSCRPRIDQRDAFEQQNDAAGTESYGHRRRLGQVWQ